MDVDSGWALLFALALAIPLTMIGLASSIGWWWIVISPLPLVAWNIAWLIMANSSRTWRIAISAAIGIGSLFIIGLGIYGITHDAQAQAPSSVNGNCNDTGNNNFNCNTLNVGPPRQPNGLYQNGRFLGTTNGVTVSPDQKQVTLFNLHISGIGMDLAGALELQRALIRCPSLAPMSNPDTNKSVTIEGKVVCDIIGKR